METFGQYLKRLRSAKRITLTELARLSGVSQPHLSLVENSKRETPSPEIIRKLSAALGVTHNGMMIKAGYITEDEVLTMREQHGINQH